MEKKKKYQANRNYFCINIRISIRQTVRDFTNTIE